MTPLRSVLTTPEIEVAGLARGGGATMKGAMSPNARIVFFTIAAQHALRACGGADGTFAVFFLQKNITFSSNAQDWHVGCSAHALGMDKRLVSHRQSDE